ncbi:YrzI family small protein [Cytobacillus spongiae]|jgi:uncharacterized protein (TIGR02413 family)|nr:YrzI family small protein [Cytobacillus spongiae]UII54963.1 YrzI family small protein [Cytobacillus spongiae]
MTLNILFLTITVKKRNLTPEDAIRQQEARKIHEQNKDRQFSIYRPF